MILNIINIILFIHLQEEKFILVILVVFSAFENVEMRKGCEPCEKRLNKLYVTFDTFGYTALKYKVLLLTFVLKRFLFVLYLRS